MTATRDVDTHYHRDGIAERILQQWRQATPDVRAAGPGELSPLDEMHVRSRAATAELAALAHLDPDARVLDAGCGLGGSARYLAATFGCRVLGVDLTGTLCAAAAALSAAVGLSERTSFVRGSATALPLAAGRFRVVWTQHAQMNIPDKAAFYGQLAGALAPGGSLLFHDVFATDGRELVYPVPWAGHAGISHLCGSNEAHEHLVAAGLRRAIWEDRTLESMQWASGVLNQRGAIGPSLVMGAAAGEKLANLETNLVEGALQVVMARYDRPC